MTRRTILLLGNQRLYETSLSVSKEETNDLPMIIDDLHDTLMGFREQYGVGRAIAAPQIGVFKRIVYLNVDEPITMVNPEIVSRSKEEFELWDDCMSFPGLLVRVRRHREISVEYRDLSWNKVRLDCSDDMSELLQHEIDHLDGILAVQRAIDSKSFAFRSEL